VQTATGLERDQAEELLQKSGDEVKTAILVGKTNLTPQEAREHLTTHAGVLRAALDELA
jgi:N-acetylmuramic acid 6-phosphate (MurNAc-6-P) etherase